MTSQTVLDHLGFKESTQLVAYNSETKTENLVRSLKFKFEGLNFSSES